MEAIKQESVLNEPDGVAIFKAGEDGRPVKVSTLSSLNDSPTDPWVFASDRQPAEDGAYFVAGTAVSGVNATSIAWFSDGHWCDTAHFPSVSIYAWQPLPDAPPAPVSHFTYDSRPETRAHIKRVQDLIDTFLVQLRNRAIRHDQSKLREPELSLFNKFKPILRDLEYGSAEYQQVLVDMGPALQHHYEHNRHHPEHFKWWTCLGAQCGKFMPSEIAGDGPALCPICGCSMHLEDKGINGMTLIDLVEMVCDWKAASEEKEGSFINSIRYNEQRFGMSQQLTDVIINTAEAMEWM